jgi:hypothetical protein
MLTYKTGTPQIPANPYLENSLQSLEKTIHEWIHQSKILQPTIREQSRNDVITRTGLLIHFAENFTEQQEAGHEILLLATRNPNNTVYFNIVDNLDRSDYSDHVQNKSALNICENFIRSALPAASSTQHSITLVKNDVPHVPEKKYTCMSSARRAAIYAAIILDIMNTDVWLERDDSVIFNQHLQLYTYHISRMIDWFYSDDAFWFTDPPFIIAPAECFHSNDIGDFDLDQNMIVNLNPHVAYVIVYDMSNRREEEQAKRYYFRSQGPTPFVQEEDPMLQKGTCRVSRKFESYI